MTVNIEPQQGDHSHRPWSSGSWPATFQAIRRTNPSPESLRVADLSGRFARSPGPRTAARRAGPISPPRSSAPPSAPGGVRSPIPTDTERPDPAGARTRTRGVFARASSSSGRFPCIPRGRWGASSPIPIRSRRRNRSTPRRSISLGRRPAHRGLIGDWREWGERATRRYGYAPASVVVLEGPGGFPVLAAASLASRPPLTDVAAVACLPGSPDRSGRATTTAVMGSRADESREGDRPTRRSSIAFALHFAALMATGLLFPDFVTLLGDREPRRRRTPLLNGCGARVDGALALAAQRGSIPRATRGDRAGAECVQVRRPRVSTRGEPSRPLPRQAA